MKNLRRILVVDASRVVRATLHKHLKDDFEILEESNGESAWQILVLDAGIVAVISGVHTPKLEAYDLLARLNASHIPRLRSIPLALIVSDTVSQEERELGFTRGVAAFITKSMKKSAIIECVNGLIETEVLTFSDVLPELSKDGKQKTSSASLSATPSAPRNFLENDQFRSVLENYSTSDLKRDTFCALVFAIDDLSGFSLRFGDAVAEMIAARFAGLLVSKVGTLDSIGRCGGERLAIFSHGVDLKQGLNFGKRVCKSLASGQITIRGQQVRLTASVGVASSSDDGEVSGGELLALAEKRLEQALLCGGNTVASEFRPECPLHCPEKIASRLIEALASNDSKKLAEKIGGLGLQIFPLVQVMDQELGLRLPLAEIRQQLELRARTEAATS